MPRLTALSLGIVAALLTAAPARAAVTPKTLPAVVASLTAQQRGSCTATTYRAPLTGFLDARLRGSGDWDLEPSSSAMSSAPASTSSLSSSASIRRMSFAASSSSTGTRTFGCATPPDARSPRPAASAVARSPRPGCAQASASPREGAADAAPARAP